VTTPALGSIVGRVERGDTRQFNSAGSIVGFRLRLYPTYGIYPTYGLAEGRPAAR